MVEGLFWGLGAPPEAIGGLEAYAPTLEKFVLVFLKKLNFKLIQKKLVLSNRGIEISGQKRG